MTEIEVYDITRNGKLVACVPVAQVNEYGAISTLAPFLSERDRRCLERGEVRRLANYAIAYPRDSRGRYLEGYFFQNYFMKVG